MAAAQDGYRYTQETPSAATSNGNAGPVRMARISYIQGGANWRPDESVDWSTAAPNLPLRQGAEIWVNAGGRTEIQFDDGSRLRLGSNAVATLLTMYSDSKGEFTEVKISSGLASATLTNRESMYQLDTPMTSVKAFGPGKLRIGCGDDVEVAVRGGEAQLEGSQGSTTLHHGDYVDVVGDNSPLRIRNVPHADSWDQFCDGRDTTYDHPSSYVPSNISLCSGDLDSYGVWRPDPSYGHVWYPNATYVGWRPYHDGHWVWVEPFGWTWIADEPWGWAPYHYGTWIHASNGWGWCPGPRLQFWSPAVVSFSVYNGAVAWCPLAPTEVYYPASFSVGFGSGNWFFSFSIGGAACYGPGSGRFCVAHPWGNGFLNRPFGGFDSRRVAGIYGNRAFVGTSRFVPLYGRNAFAITRTTTAGFSGIGRFQSGTSSDTSIFSKGRALAAPHGIPPVFGPATVRPTIASLTPSRSFVSDRPSSAITDRPVYRSTLPSAIARLSSPVGKTLSPSEHNNATSRTSTGSGIHSGASRSTSTSKYSRYNSGSSIRQGTGLDGRTNDSRYTSPSKYSGTSRTRTSGTVNRERSDSGSRYSRSSRSREPGRYGNTERSSSGSRYRNSGSSNSGTGSRNGSTPSGRSGNSRGSDPNRRSRNN